MAIDKLTIDTPEQVPLEFMLAGIGSRFMAAFLDILIELVVYLALFLLTLLWWSSGWLTGNRSIWWEALVSLVLFCISHDYCSICCSVIIQVLLHIEIGISFSRTAYAYRLTFLSR